MIQLYSNADWSKLKVDTWLACLFSSTLWGTCLTIHIGLPAWSILRTPAAGCVSLSEGWPKVRDQGMALKGLQTTGDRTFSSLQSWFCITSQVFWSCSIIHVLSTRTSAVLWKGWLQPHRHCSALWSFAPSFLPHTLTRWHVVILVNVFRSSDWPLSHTPSL